MFKTKTRARFSARQVSHDRKLIIDDAPERTRIGYIRGVLEKFVGETWRQRGARPEPLEISEVHSQFITICRLDAEPHDWSEQGSWPALTSHLKSCDWTQFYDFVELLGDLLIGHDDHIPFDSSIDFDGYRGMVNALFDEDRIGWVLDPTSSLVRRARALERAVVGAETALTGPFRIARDHYRKALQYLLQHPVDEGNSVKEIISAVESVAKVVSPGASTLGKALIELKKDGRFDPRLLQVMEKLYAYSNDAAMVRHGQVAGRGPTIAEAELTVHLGLASICYLTAVNELGDP